MDKELELIVKAIKDLCNSGNKVRDGSNSHLILKSDFPKMFFHEQRYLEKNEGYEFDLSDPVYIKVTKK